MLERHTAEPPIPAREHVQYTVRERTLRLVPQAPEEPLRAAEPERLQRSDAMPLRPRRRPGPRPLAVIGALAVTAVVSLGIARPYSRRTSRSSVSGVDGDSVHVSVSLSKRALVVEHDDSVVSRYSVAIGMAQHPTPPGQYTIQKIEWNPAWVPPPNSAWAKGKQPQPPGARANPMQLVKMYFKEPDYYIHGTNDPDAIGEAASHGCLRMTPEDASALARYLMEHGGASKPDTWYDQVLHDKSETSTVMLKVPISVTIAP